MNIQYKKEPLVSVILCTYNDEKYIRESIGSILRQSFPDFEFIIWNDGSSDRTEEIVKSYNDPRIRYFYHENTGLGEALRLACNEAKGKYIARIDGDDIALPQRLEKEVEYLEAHPNCVLVSTAVIYIDENGNVLGRSFPYTWNGVLKKAISFNNPFVHPASMYRADAYFKTKGYPGTRCFQDRIMFKQLSSIGLVGNLCEPLLRYRISSKSVSHSLGEYMPVLRAIEKLLVENQDQREENIALFNKTYELAKRLQTEQVGNFFNNKWGKICRMVSYCLPLSWAITITFFLHNLMGWLYYSIKR